MGPDLSTTKNSFVHHSENEISLQWDKETTQNGTRQNALTCQLCSFLLCLLVVSYLGNFAVSLDLGIWNHPDTPTRGFILRGFLSKAFSSGRFMLVGLPFLYP